MIDRKIDRLIHSGMLLEKNIVKKPVALDLLARNY